MAANNDHSSLAYSESDWRPPVLHQWLEQQAALRAVVTQEPVMDPGQLERCWRIVVAPFRPQSCPIEIVLTSSGIASISLDRWSSIAERLGVRRLSGGLGDVDLVGAFLEGQLSADLVMGICLRVAAGEVALCCGLIGGRLASTNEVRDVSSDAPKLYGAGYSLALVRLLRAFGCGDIRQISYEPW